MQSPRWTRFVIFIGAAFAALVLAGYPAILRGPDEWRWPLAAAPPIARLALSLGAMALFVACWIWQISGDRLEKNGRLALFLNLLTLWALIAAVQFALLALNGQQPIAVQFQRLASDQASGYFTVAQEIEHLPDFLRDFPEQMPNFRPNPHPRSKPPGIILLYWAGERALERLPAIAAPLGRWARGVQCDNLWLATRPDAALATNALAGILIPLVSALIVFPAFGLASGYWGRRAGWLAAGLAALMPGRLAFTPHMDTVYPFLALTAVWLTAVGLRRKQPLYTLLGGLLISGATFLSLVNGLIAVLAGMVIIFTLIQERWERPLRAFLLQGIALTAGTLSLWILYWLTSNVTPFAIYAAAAPARHDLERNYWTWLIGNLYDFAIFAGLTAFLLAIPSRRRQIAPLTLAFWLSLLALNATGGIRGEVGRIWLMLAPFPAVLAAGLWQDGRRRRLPMLALLVTAAGAWAIGARWEVTQLEWPPLANRAVESAPPAAMIPQPAQFGASIRLLGYTVDEREGEATATLYWQADERPQVPYTVFVHALNAEGEIVAQHDGMPQNGRLPATCWQSGEVVADPHTIASEQLGTQPYRLSVGLYDQGTGERLGTAVTLP